jgi:hypothetical protein
LEVITIDARSNFCAFMARVYFDDGTMFTDAGDASPENTAGNTLAAFVRMASTRAISRALAQALNADTNAAEEFGPQGATSSRGGKEQFPAAKQNYKPKPKPKVDDDEWEDE